MYEIDWLAAYFLLSHWIVLFMILVELFRFLGVKNDFRTIFEK